MKRKFIIASLVLTVPIAIVLIMTAHGSNGRLASEIGQTYSGTFITTKTTNADHSVVVTWSNGAAASQTNITPQAR